MTTYDSERLKAQSKGVAKVLALSDIAKGMSDRGETLYAIAVALDVPVSTVEKLLQPGGVFQSRRKPKVDHEKILAMSSDGLEASSIADLVGCGLSTVYRVLKGD